jgi:hypothetical protein
LNHGCPRIDFKGAGKTTTNGRDGSWLSEAQQRKPRKSKSAREKATKRTKRAALKKARRKKVQRTKQPTPAVETTIVDVIEEPAPGVITVTELEETRIPARRDEREEC